MRRLYTLAGVGVLTACLAGWAALALAQPNTDKPPTRDGSPSAPVAGGAASGSFTPIPSPKSVEKIEPVPVKVAEPVTPTTVSTEPMASPAPAIVPAPGSLPGLAPVPDKPDSGPGSTTLPESLPATSGPASESVGPVPGPAPRPASTGSAEPSALPEERDVEPAVMNEGVSSRQAPSVSLEWTGAPTAKLGQAGDYNLVVRNASSVPVYQVVVRVRMPATVNVSASEPRAATENSVLTWNLGKLGGQQEKTLQMKLVATTRGEITPQAWVTFSTMTALRIAVRESKIVLKATAPPKVLIGDLAAFTLTASNPGDGPTEQVRIQTTLSDGLEHARGNKFDFEIGNLAAGESRNVTVLCATRAAGPQKCEAVATAEGGLKSHDSVSINVIMPRLDLAVVGPALRYLDRKAVYTLKVTNPGDAPATNVTVADTVPDGFKVLAASDGGRHDFQQRNVSWFLGEIGPGATREVRFEVQAVAIGTHKHVANAVGARGLRATAELSTRVEGLSALMLEMVDTEDPIEVNGETAYEVRITNTGSKTETDIKLLATIPEKMEFKSAQGPARYRQEGTSIVFDPLERLAPQANAIFRIKVKALDPGTVRFKIQVTSTNLVEPVIKMEATRIYSDSPEAKPDTKLETPK